MSINTIIFDLDGTLIDSSGSILATFSAILDEKTLTPRVPLNHTLIGPPLTATLKLISGLEDATAIDRLATAFKARYDKCGYRESSPVKGTDTLLAELSNRGFALYIVTNKRHHPTTLILEHLGWTGFFCDVCTPDSVSPAHPTKAAALAALMSDHDLDPAKSAYIGDTPEDAEAARKNGLIFFRTKWGYGTWPNMLDDAVLASPMDLLNHLPE